MHGKLDSLSLNRYPTNLQYVEIPMDGHYIGQILTTHGTNLLRIIWHKGGEYVNKYQLNRKKQIKLEGRHPERKYSTIVGQSSCFLQNGGSSTIEKWMHI